MAEDYDKLICSAQNTANELERQADAAEAKGSCGCEVASAVASSVGRVAAGAVIASVTGLPIGSI